MDIQRGVVGLRNGIILRKQSRPLTSKPPLKSIDIKYSEKDCPYHLIRSPAVAAAAANILPPIESVFQQLRRISRGSSSDKENIYCNQNAIEYPSPVCSSNQFELLEFKPKNQLASHHAWNPITTIIVNSITPGSRSPSHQRQQNSYIQKRTKPQLPSEYTPIICLSERRMDSNQETSIEHEANEHLKERKDERVITNSSSRSNININDSFEQHDNSVRVKQQFVRYTPHLIPKKPRVLSIKRAQNPDISLLDSAHPLISTRDCFPICKQPILLHTKIQYYEKKQITSFPPSVTSKSWALFDGSSGQFIDGKCVHNQREVASLTKIMTCYTVIHFFEEVIRKDMKKLFVKVSTRAAAMSGTSARLRSNMMISIWDLLFGLMLPSGNDSAFCLAETVGSLMYVFNKGNQDYLDDEILYSGQKLCEYLDQSVQSQTGINRFLFQMNQNALEMDLINTTYCNPHGLKNSFNKSSAYDVAKICASAMHVASFKQIVNTKSYTATVNLIDSNQGATEEIVWENTNKLLEKGWAGIKTGVTDAAGPCLATCIKLKDTINNVYRNIIIVILNAQSMDIRWEECQKIAAWAVGSSSQDS